MHFNTETVDVVSNPKGQMSGILIRKADTQEESVLEAKGLFYGIGHSPNSQLLEGQVELDNSGYILVKEGTANTSVEGVFAAGDVQVLTAIYYFISAVPFPFLLTIVVLEVVISHLRMLRLIMHGPFRCIMSVDEKHDSSLVIETFELSSQEKFQISSSLAGTGVE